MPQKMPNLSRNLPRKVTYYLLFAHVHSQIVAAASIRGRCLFRSVPQIVRRLFEGGVYSRAASIRGNTVVLGWSYKNTWLIQPIILEIAPLACSYGSGMSSQVSYGPRSPAHFGRI